MYGIYRDEAQDNDLLGEQGQGGRNEGEEQVEGEEGPQEDGNGQNDDSGLDGFIVQSGDEVSG